MASKYTKVPMSRLGYLLFTVLLSAILYGIAYAGGSQKVLEYTILYFSLPLIFANFFMALFSLVHAYVRNHNEDIASEGVTFLHAVWITALITAGVYLSMTPGIMPKISAFLTSHHIHFR